MTTSKGPRGCDSLESDFIPSAKYPCSASLEMLTKGKTASEGLLGGARVRPAPGVATRDFASLLTRNARTGSFIFLIC